MEHQRNVTSSLTRKLEKLLVIIGRGKPGNAILLYIVYQNHRIRLRYKTGKRIEREVINKKYEDNEEMKKMHVTPDPSMKVRRENKALRNELTERMTKDDQQIGSILRGDEVPESSYSDGNTSDSLLIPEESILLPDNIDNTADKPESSVMEESKNDEKPNQESEHEEQVWCNIQTKNGDLLFGNIYHSPSSTQENQDKLRTLITDSCNKGSRNIIIVGDFNPPSIDWESWNGNSQRDTMFIETLQDHYQSQHMKEPARYRFGQKPSLVDLVISNEEDLEKDLLGKVTIYAYSSRLKQNQI
ncbi:hypothetical protein LSH36_500g02048 [Paralvinella palmiformis]|uniref:Endonuclease/exonuclease/phosphatase domain-containing protein n=1 Tax=Paralvinella palmiformis TaxID=53620 RepID=A0AAD9J935_9ANNE|nr:hypothetical protein LSH36_500g02048 [Paralvinella palmiformis]